jgi:hypothetical protein
MSEATYKAFILYFANNFCGSTINDICASFSLCIFYLLAKMGNSKLSKEKVGETNQGLSRTNHSSLPFHIFTTLWVLSIN